jgi:hypothetical protein
MRSQRLGVLLQPTPQAVVGVDGIRICAGRGPVVVAIPGMRAFPGQTTARSTCTKKQGGRKPTMKWKGEDKRSPVPE